MKRPVYDLNEAREKIRRYCVYRERSHREVEERLKDMALNTNAIDQLLLELIEEGFLNEERFARAYVRGKFNQKGWGRQKIEQALHWHRIHPGLLQRALEEIDPREYQNRLDEILRKRWEHAQEESDFAQRGAVARYAWQRGFENDLIWERIEALFPPHRP